MYTSMLRKIKDTVGEFLPALRSPNYRLYFWGQGISLVGTWMQDIAQSWLIYPVLTNNKSLLGVVSFVNLIPTAILALFAGVIVDRVNRKKGLIATQSAFALIAFVLWLLIVTKSIAVWHVLIATFLTGVVFAFDMPFRQSFMIELVEKKYYGSAIGLNAAIFNAARAIGPAIAGVLIATIGISTAYLVNAISFFAMIFGVWAIRVAPTIKQVTKKPFKEGLYEGLGYIRQNKVLLVLLGILFCLTLFTWPQATLLPVFAHDIFHMNELGFGLLHAFFGMGALVAALLFYKIFTSTKNIYRLLIAALSLAVVTQILFSFSTMFAFSLLLQFIGGWAVITVITFCNTLLQTTVPTELRGRIASFYSLVLIGGMPFGGLLGSIGVATVGPRMTVGISGVLLGITTFVLIKATNGKFQTKLAGLM